MTASVRKLARASVSAALGSALLYAGSFVPTGRLTLLCAASLGVVFVCLSCSARWALGTYLTTAALSLLLCPTKGAALAYALFFGWYPVAKTVLERLDTAWIRWGAKLACFNAVFLPAFFIAGRMLAPERLSEMSSFLVVFAAELAFLVYDYALKELILFYIRKISRRMK